MIFVPFSWADYYGQGIQRVLCAKGDRMLCAMTADGFDAGFAMLEGVDENIIDLDGLGGRDCRMWEPSGVHGPSVFDTESNLEEGYCCDSVVNYSNEEFERAVRDLL